LVFSIDDSTEAVTQRKIEAMRKFIREGEEDQEGIPISSITKRHFQLQIKTLEDAPRDVSKLQQIIKAKETENKEARHIDDTLRLVTEIEMLQRLYWNFWYVGAPLACMSKPLHELPLHFLYP
jgi:ATP-dependent protease HslVU (ClpYQ) ATPase subunit